MVETLPRNIQLKLDQTLAQWRHWRCEPALSKKPAIVRTLSGGLSNFSILVESVNQFVVRIDGLNPAVIGLSRQTEWSALRSASSAGLAPHPRYYNPDLGSLVSDYIHSDQAQTSSLGAIASLLRGIHKLPAVHFRLDLPERIIRYEKHIEHRNRSPHPLLAFHRNHILTLVENINTTGQDAVLCHNDLLRANRIMSGGQLRAIDWEYCAMGSHWFDLAVVSVGDGLSEDETLELLRGYFGPEVAAGQSRELAKWECVYRYLELMWFSALDDQVERAKQLTDSKLQQFEISLKQTSGS